jgi:hypothetical protein
VKLVDTVNFNADGSCLRAERWLASLEGGRQSLLCAWLNSYVERSRKICIGWIGATLADVRRFNPEALDIVNRFPEVFECLLRPFAHDAGLLRTAAGFRRNIELGMAATWRELTNVAPFYLPPEFMLTSTGIHDLAERGVQGVFINSSRFGADLSERIPVVPYRVRGVLGSELTCIPIAGDLTKAWLDSVHGFDSTPWNVALLNRATDSTVSWRDGETFLFLPQGLEREKAWLDGEDRAIERVHLGEFLEPQRHSEGDGLSEAYFRSYPPHSFMEWFRESRMLGFIQRVGWCEQRVEQFAGDEIALWLQAINSDVLSAVEKESPRVRLRLSPGSEEYLQYQILRSERGFEGEEYLALLEGRINGSDGRTYWAGSSRPHLIKLQSRADYLRDRESE